MLKVGDFVMLRDSIRRQEPDWPTTPMEIIEVGDSHSIKLFHDDHPLGRWRAANCFYKVEPKGPW